MSCRCYKWSQYPFTSRTTKICCSSLAFSLKPRWLKCSASTSCLFSSSGRTVLSPANTYPKRSNNSLKACEKLPAARFLRVLQVFYFQKLPINRKFPVLNTPGRPWCWSHRSWSSLPFQCFLLSVSQLHCWFEYNANIFLPYLCSSHM